MAALTRRRFLTTSAPAAVAVGASTAAVAAYPQSEENPELVAAAAWFRHEHAIAVGLKEKEEEARARYAAIEPPIPPDLIVRRGDPCGDFFGDMAVDRSGGGYRLVGPRLASVYETERRLADVNPRSVLGRYLAKKLKVAREYEGAVEKAQLDCRISETATAAYLAEVAAMKALEALFALDARSPEGVRLKAEALSIIVVTLDKNRGYERFGLALATEAASVLKMEARP